MTRHGGNELKIVTAPGSGGGGGAVRGGVIHFPPGQGLPEAS